MTEQQIQSKRIKQLEKDGYYVIKLIKTNKNGIADLLAIPPNVPVLFCEVKTPKGVLSDLQKYRMKELEAHGCKTEVYRGEPLYVAPIPKGSFKCYNCGRIAPNADMWPEMIGTCKNCPPF